MIIKVNGKEMTTRQAIVAEGSIDAHNTRVTPATPGVREMIAERAGSVDLTSTLYVADGNLIRVRVSAGIFRDIEPEECALIVRAVNSHDALVEALATLVEQFDSGTAARIWQSSKHTRAKITQARAALELAKGE